MAVVHLPVQRQDQGLEPLPRRKLPGREGPGPGAGRGFGGGSLGAETPARAAAAASRSQGLRE